MNKKKLISTIIILLFIPLLGFAFNFKNLFWWQRPVEPVKEKTIAVATQQKLTIDQKHNNWETAFEKDNINLLFNNPDNFIFSEAEINYILEKELSQQKNPPIKDAKIFLQNGEVEIKGYLLQPFEGSVLVKIQPLSKGKELVPKITKARFRGFYFPKSIAEKLLIKEIQPTLKFLYSYPNYNKIDIIISDQKLQLRYKN